MGNKEWSIKELVKKLGVSRATINTYLRTGKLPARKERGRIIVSEADLKQYYLNCRIVPRGK